MDEVPAGRNERVRAARTAARAAPDDPDKLMAASKQLAIAAGVALHRGLLESLEADPPESVDELLARFDELSKAVRSEVLALALEGRDLAGRAARQAPHRVDAPLYYALHIGFEAWAKGRVRALLDGLGGQLPQAIQAVVDLDPEYDYAAPLRLQGRFLDRAPWPYRDRKGARRSLTRATKLHPLAIHHLYLAEVLWRLGEREQAAAHWRAVLKTRNDPSTAAVLEPQRRLARLALGLWRDS